MREFAVEFEVRKGLGPDTFIKTIFIGLDDLDPCLDETEIQEIAIADACEELRRRGYRAWHFREILDA